MLKIPKQMPIRLWFAAVCCAVLALPVYAAQLAKPALAALPITVEHRHARPEAAQPTQDSIFDATNLGSPAVLTHGWRVGITANADAAKPEFDDSAWMVRDASQSFADVPDSDRTDEDKDEDTAAHPRGEHGHERPWAWFRLHLRLAPHTGPLALLVELPVSQATGVTGSNIGPGLDLYANGKLIHPDGPHGDAPGLYQPITRLYQIDVPAGQTDLVLVARTIYFPTGFDAYTNFFATRKFVLGSPDVLSRHVDLWQHRMLFERLPRLVNGLLLTGLAIFLLALFFTQKGHVEYLFLALHELMQAPTAFADMAGSFAWLDRHYHDILLFQLVALSTYFYFEFLIKFLSLKRGWFVRIMRYSAVSLGMVGVAPLLLLLHLVHGWQALSLALVTLIGVLWIVCWFFFVLITLARATLRRNFEATLLLVPFVLSIVGVLEPALTGQMAQIGGRPYLSPLTIQAGPVPIHFAAVAEFLGMISIVLIIFFRFLRVQREQERASTELAAARNVQELILPLEKPRTPGFEVDSVYEPAAEVGGDFFYTLPIDDGGLLIVLGDVAGKGLKAAMNVSMLVGALRRGLELSPAKLLAELNTVLSGFHSMTTCQAALFRADGELILANAGHLPPYLNSQEIAVAGGLPLGLVSQVEYEEIRLYLHPGDRVLFYSDGVVEARRPDGELFGFERLRNLSNQSAFYLSDAAKSFGQEDDITVLTVRRE